MPPGYLAPSPHVEKAVASARSQETCGNVGSIKSALRTQPLPVPNRNTINTMTQRFSAQQWIPCPVEQVFAFFADPFNLPRLMPEMLKTRIDEARLQPAPVPPGPHKKSCLPVHRAAGIGSELWISFRPVPFLPFRVRWLAQITEFEWNSHFKDEQARGPFSFFRHRHGTRAEIHEGQPGTLVTDEIDFELPFGLLGRLLAPMVCLQMQSAFAQRKKRLLQLLTAEDGYSTPPTEVHHRPSATIGT